MPCLLMTGSALGGCATPPSLSGMLHTPLWTPTGTRSSKNAQPVSWTRGTTTATTTPSCGSRTTHTTSWSWCAPLRAPRRPARRPARPWRPARRRPARRPLNALSTYDWFCPWGLRYATQSEWDAAYATLDSNRDTFFQKCAASQLDPRHDHCDYNTFVREPDNSYNELVLVCPPAGTPTPSPTPSPTVAAGSPTASPTPSPTAGPLPSGGTGGPGQVDPSGKGDPHLQNVHGQRFDLMKPGQHVLINIPRGQRADRALLRVQAYARRLGGCADMYFQELNVTGSWAEFQQAGGYRYTVLEPPAKTSEWLAFEQVELKVVHGKTKRGLKYLNFYVKHLSRTSFSVGGLLGEDDHTAVTIPTAGCSRRVALLEAPPGAQGGRTESSVAVASP
ncbi:unnamed protein product [Prorocentrum cordatum]|uniref:Uncharacterized protein n=1 Tax=Prorocentrum cordatum TaxID=2364126 RepID=A0ABN9UND8_9DINO|nr:unnamed protein product [Polarella glacialis]